MRDLLLVGFLAISLGFSACSKNDDVTEEVLTDPIEAVEIDTRLLIDLVNEVRIAGTTCGETYYPPVGLVTWNDKLEQSAINHSTDMFTNDFFSHTSSDGSSLTNRLQAVEYNYSSAGENIALGYTTEQAVLDAWLDSQGHCANIMNGSFKEMGVGRVGNYWTQNFGSQR
jgi:uncharacterized protein YkwD